MKATAISIKMILLAVIGGVAIAAAGLTYEVWTPAVTAVAKAVTIAIATPDPDHA